MTKYCDLLLKTYNSNILDTTEYSIRNIFLNISIISDKIKQQKGNQTLLKLLTNYRLRREQSSIAEPKYIQGPNNLSLHWNSEYQMTIYIFGENHFDKVSCQDLFYHKTDSEKLHIKKSITSIQDFIYNLAQTTPAFIDLYLEIPTFIENGTHKKSQMDLNIHKIYNSLFECTRTYSRHSKLCNLTRLHYVDIRQGDKEVNDLSYLINTLYANNAIHSDKHVKNIIRKLSTTNSIEYYNYIESQLDSQVATKELEKSFLKKEIKQFCIKRIRKFAGEYKKYLQDNIQKLFTDKKVVLGQILFVLITINSVVMDIYTLSRIFKRFDITRPKSIGSKPNYQPEIPHNIVIYAGSKHCECYRQFLKYIGTEEISTTKIQNDDSHNTCLDLSDFPMPFFNNFPPVGKK